MTTSVRSLQVRHATPASELHPLGVLPADIQADLDRARLVQERAVRYAHEAADLWRGLPVRLVEAGVEPAEVAAILGVSVARVRQLLAP